MLVPVPVEKKAKVELVVAVKLDNVPFPEEGLALVTLTEPVTDEPELLEDELPGIAK